METKTVYILYHKDTNRPACQKGTLVVYETKERVEKSLKAFEEVDRFKGYDPEGGYEIREIKLIINKE